MPDAYAIFPEAYHDDHILTAETKTEKEALAKAVEWYVVHKFIDISISDGSQSYSIAEFSSMIELGQLV